MVEKKKIREIVDLWKLDKKQYVKKSTYSAYLLLVENHLLPAFGEMDEITEGDVQHFVFGKLNEGLSQKSIKDILIVLKMVLRFGVKHRYLEYQEIDIKFPTEREVKDLEVLSISNQKKLLNFLRENFTFKNLGVFITLNTGMRIGEMCGLMWGDFDTDSGIIKVRRTVQRIYIIEESGERHTEISIDTPKTKNSIRDIPMTTELLKILKPLKKVVNDNYFLLTNEAKPTEPRIYRNYYKRILKKLEIPYLKFHGLRHSFATRCVESKCDYKTISVILGHSNISTTLNLYVHPNLEQKKKCIDQMNKVLK